MKQLTAIITGVSRGIGRACAKLLLEEGWKVVGTSTSGKGHIDNMDVYKLDLADPENIQEFTLEMRKSHPKVNALVNNAAILVESWSDSEVNLDILRRTFEVNFFGTVHLTEALLDTLQPGSTVINLSSGWGTFSDPSFSAEVPHYKMSKTAINMYSKLLADRLKDREIKVYALNPGWVKTDMGTSAATKSPAMAAHEILHVIQNSFPTGSFLNGNRIGKY